MVRADMNALKNSALFIARTLLVEKTVHKLEELLNNTIGADLVFLQNLNERDAR